eukprot:CAMPEP_0176081682 /NCGR_PEP_ID=MMETSP0120_2-20121206/40858_1 /TAXON_ID=160619 /ORGANISM="Kryptoperidinium foliaceum, Strain CCMP 1326" /LENGTH=423 /DNA_ID=CAMNT_0017415449 /DNA_START=84 /DNA_END=1355 /DNA_ORIENTATION=+
MSAAAALARAGVTGLAGHPPDIWNRGSLFTDTALLDLRAVEEQSPPSVRRPGCLPNHLCRQKLVVPLAAKPLPARIFMVFVVVTLAVAFSAGMAAVVAGSVLAGGQEEAQTVTSIGVRAATGLAARSVASATTAREAENSRMLLDIAEAATLASRRSASQADDLDGSRADRRSLGAGANSRGEAAPCASTVKGDVCHRLATWVQEDGLSLFPEQYIGLSRDSPLEAFQAAVHRLHPEYCPPPCGFATGPLRPQAAGGDSGFTAATRSRLELHSAADGATALPENCEYGRQDAVVADARCAVVRNGKLLVVRQDSGEYELPGGRPWGMEPARCTAHLRTLEGTGYHVAPRELAFVQPDGAHVYACDLVELRSHLRRSGRSDAPAPGDDGKAERVGWLDKQDVLASLSWNARHSAQAEAFLSLLS